MGRHEPMVEVSILEGETGNRRIDIADRLVSFEYQDESQKADRVIIRLDNYDLFILDDPTWRRGQLLQVSWGYPENMATPQLVVIKRISGGLTLTVEAISRSVLLNGIQKTLAFHNQKRSQVVESIAKDNGFGPGSTFIDQTDKVFETINQAGETDAQFIKRLARKENFLFYVDSAGLHWGRERFDEAPSKVFTYFTDPDRGDILNFSVDSDLFNAPGKMKLKGRNPETKQVFEVGGSDTDTKYTDLGSELEVVDERTGVTKVTKRMVHERVIHTSATDEQAAKREADVRFKKAAQEKIKLKLSVIGSPTIAAKRTVEVKGLGNYLSGKYFVRAARHKIGTGYTVEVMLKRGTATKVPTDSGSAPASKAAQNTKAAQPDTDLVEDVDERTGASTYRRGDR